MALQQPAANTLARSLSIAGTLASPSSKKQAAGGTLNTVLARRLRDALPKLRPLAESQSESELLTQLANLKLDADLPYIKALTVKASMFTLRTMRRALDAVAASTRSEGDVPPLLGSKDMHVVGMLIAIIARWGLAACVEPGVLPDTMRDDLLGGEGRQEAIEELPDVPLLELDALVKEVIELGAPSEGPSTSTAVPNPLPELISTRTHICIVAALLQIKHNGKAGSEWASEQLSIILQRLHPAGAMAALLHILSGSSPGQSETGTPKWLATSIASLLSAQLMRDEGVVGLMQLIVGEQDEEPNASQLEQISRVLLTIPSKTPNQLYFGKVVPRMLRFVRAAASTALWPSEDVSPLRDVFVRTATYALSQMVDRRPKDAALHLQPLLHRALLPSPDAREKRTSNIVGDPVVTSPVELLADLRILTLFAVNSHPSPRLYPFIFDPILAPLLSLFLFVRSQPTTDPVLRDEIQSLLVLYVRTAEKAEMAIDRVLDGLRDLETGSSSFYWSRDADGGTCLRRRIAERAAEEGEEDTMMVAYDAKDVAALLKEADRKEVSGGLFLRWLDELEHYSKQGGLEAAKSSILRLSLVTEALGTVGDSIISKPRELLAFIRHTLVYEPTNSSHPSPNGNSLLDDQLGADLDDLRVTTDEQQDAAASDEMRLTALTLLLAFLTGETEIEEEEAGILAVLKPAVDRIANSDASVELIAAAREARTVLALRSAAAVIPNGRNEEQSPFAESHKVYQESLRLLEDPILPVRGHGLAQLAGLVKAGRTPAADPALRPAILDIFVRALENDDSFLYLTAIHGLRDFASSGKGRDVVSRLAGIFASVERKLDWASQKGGREQDRRLRAGEALTQIVADRGQALSTTVDLLVPPLLLAFRDPDLPIPLRASSFTLLASAVEASPLSLAPYTSSLLDASVTLLSLETRPFVRNVTTEPEPAYPPPNRTDAPKYEETPDAATKDAKGHPALRRSACLFIALLFRSAERDAALMLLRDHGKRAETALGYVGDVDEDGLVRVQAKTALEAMRASVQ